jgi:hypothetical protein
VKPRLLLSVLVCLMMVSGVSWGAPSLVGPTGLLTTPTAEVMGMAQWNVGASAVRVDEGADRSILYANLGFVSKLEVGATREKLEGAEAETLINAKIQVLGPLPGKISLAAGVIDITDRVDRSGYAVLSHTLGAGLLMRGGQITSPQLHVGVGGGRFDGVFGGLSAIVGRNLTLLAEYDSEDVNVGARLPLGANLTATVAGLDGLDEVAVGLSLASPW